MISEWEMQDAMHSDFVLAIRTLIRGMERLQGYGKWDGEQEREYWDRAKGVRTYAALILDEVEKREHSSFFLEVFRWVVDDVHKYNTTRAQGRWIDFDDAYRRYEQLKAAFDRGELKSPDKPADNGGHASGNQGGNHMTGKGHPSNPPIDGNPIMPFS